MIQLLWSTEALFGLTAIATPVVLVLMLKHLAKTCEDSSDSRDL